MQVAGGRTAILAGGGTLPLELADSLIRRGGAPDILAFRGFADRRTCKRAREVADLLDVRGIIDILRRWGPERVVMAGGVHRPGASAVLSAVAALRNLDYVTDLMRSGDDRLLRGVVDLLEQEGFSVASIADLAPDLLAPAALLGHVPVPAAAETMIALGAAVLTAVSPFDVGQAVVVNGSRILAFEGPEGTDAMLARVAGMTRRTALRRVEPGGVLVKTAKIGQDLRIDMPVVGPATLARAREAGLAGIAVGAGRTLILSSDETIAEADRRGLFLLGAPLGGSA